MDTTKNHRRTPELRTLSEHPVGTPVRAVVLLLPGGAVTGHGRASRLAALTLHSPARRLVEGGRDAGVQVARLRYRYRGWNGDAADTLVDTRWALEELRREHGDVPVALFGNSLGGRAAFRAAGHRNVVAVTGVAPWLPIGEPVEQLAGRNALIIHGDRDRSDAGAAESLAYAERARTVTALRRYELAGAGHFLLPRAEDAWAAATAFTLAALTGTGPADLPAEDGVAPLRTLLPVGYATGR
ncbi:alpha/beta hydrolase [Kitasatospora sp. NPDC088134]|uniref:alpha/beta hydrolase n=1 Tax=Kitasatospora sp. NPDC088134 TaxID=3364071 RepID=UPI00380D1358